jgi:hypothetical protein
MIILSFATTSESKQKKKRKRRFHLRHYSTFAGVLVYWFSMKGIRDVPKPPAVAHQSRTREMLSAIGHDEACS